MHCVWCSLAVPVGESKTEVTFNVALVVVLLQQAAVVSQLLVFMRLSQEVCPGGRTAAVLRQGPARNTRGKDRLKQGQFEGLMKNLLTCSTLMS